MKKSLFRAFLFLFAPAIALLSYEGSSASQLASIEPEPSVLICGCVHAVTGDFLFQQPDMVVKGAEPLTIPRKYYSSGCDTSLEDQLLPHRKAYGWGIPDFIHITRLSVAEPNSMVFSYIQTTPYVYQPIEGNFQAGITGYLTDSLGNRYHPINNRVSWPNDSTLLVETSTGEVRVYEKTKFVNGRPDCQFEFRLCRIRLSSGTFIDYKYKKDRLKTISAGKNGKEFCRAEFSEKDNLLQIEGSDASKLEYKYKNYKRKKQKIKLLKCVASSLYPSERLKREEKSLRVQERHFDHGRSLLCEYDPTGRVTKVTGPQGTLATIAYEKGTTTSFDRDGNQTVYLYDPKTLRINEIQTFQGSDLLKVETYTWTPLGCLEQKTISSGDGELLVKIDCAYNEHLDLIRKTICKDQESYTHNYEYNEQHLLQEKREDSGRRITYTFLKGTTLPEEICIYNKDRLLKRTRYEYDQDLLLTSETLDDGRTYFRKEIERKKSSPFYGMLEVLSEYCGDQLLQKTKYTYDDYGNVTRTDRYGSNGILQTTTHTLYNDRGQITQEIDLEGNTTEYEYDDNGNLIWKKTPLGLEIHSTYDNANRLIEERQIGSGHTLITRYENFDALDHPTKITDPLGGITYRKYDALGNLIQETNPEGHTTTYTHDALGNVLSVTGPLGHTTTTTYNHLGRPLSITHPDGSRESYIYNPNGTKSSYTDEAGVTTLYTYDIFDNPFSEEILGSAKKTWTYDAFHLLEETNLDGYATTYEYDPLGRKCKETYEGRTTTYAYDPLSRVICEQTGNLRTEYTYDKLGRTTSEKVYDGSKLIYQTQTTYNAEGSPVEVMTYPHNQPKITKTTYDAFGRETSHTTSLGNQTQTTYRISEGKSIITTAEPGGITDVKTYNALNQLFTHERKDPSGKIFSKTEYSYDPCGNLIKQTTDPHTIEWTYDKRLRKTTETEGSQKTNHYAYYPDGKLQALTKPDGTKLSYTYNPLGHLTSLHSSKGDINYAYTYNNRGDLLLSKDLIHQIQTSRIVDPHGNILEETLANGLKLSSQYDELGRRTHLFLPDKTITYTYLGPNLASVTVDGKTHRYTYDPSHNLIQEEHIDGSITEYTYDADSRLIHRKHPLLDETLQYDQRDNLIEIIRNGEELLYSYDPHDHLISEPDHSYQYDPLHNRTRKDDDTIAFNALNQETKLTYDPNGNLHYKRSYTLEYDSLDRLVKAKTWFTQTTYTYDSEHRRILENSTPILWDGQHELGEQNFYRILGATPFAEIGSAIAICEQGKTLQPLHTVTGDIYQILGRSPLQSFTAFGEGTTSIRWGYRSKTHDPTGLIYFGRRYYDPTSGRFITSDPEGYVDGPNLYAYTLNNPLTHHDPYGLFAYPSNLQIYPQYYGENGFDPNHWKVVGAAIEHGAIANLRDKWIELGKWAGGIHGPDDMSFQDLYQATKQARGQIFTASENWMASSPYADSDFYDFIRGGAYAGLDIAITPRLPFALLKTAASASKAIMKAEKAVHNSPILLKTRALAARLFSSHKKVQSGSSGAENINASINLIKKLSQLEKVQTQGQKLRILQDGRHRYYSELIPASRPGITHGAKRVTEYNPLTGSIRTWHECYDSRGKVVRIHPKQINGQEIQSHHYPKIGSEFN